MGHENEITAAEHEHFEAALEKEPCPLVEAGPATKKPRKENPPESPESKALLEAQIALGTQRRKAKTLVDRVTKALDDYASKVAVLGTEGYPPHMLAFYNSAAESTRARNTELLDHWTTEMAKPAGRITKVEEVQASMKETEDLIKALDTVFTELSKKHVGDLKKIAA